MSTQPRLEVIVDTKDEKALRAVEEALAGADPQRLEDTRDILTVLTIASSAAGPFNALLTSTTALPRGRTPPGVTVKNADCEELDLAHASREQPEALITGRPDEPSPSS